MTNKTRIEPQPKLVWPFLAWNFGWTWGFMLLAIILKNLWPENPPVLYLALEGLLTSLSMFGPVIASLIVLKIKRLQSHLFLYLLKQERDLALSPTLLWKSGCDFCISFRRQASRWSSAFIYWILYLPYDLGWWHGRAWLARVSAAGFGKEVLYAYRLLDNWTSLGLLAYSSLVL